MILANCLFTVRYRKRQHSKPARVPEPFLNVIKLAERVLIPQCTSYVRTLSLQLFRFMLLMLFNLLGLLHFVWVKLAK